MTGATEEAHVSQWTAVFRRQASYLAKELLLQKLNCRHKKPDSDVILLRTVAQQLGRQALLQPQPPLPTATTPEDVTLLYAAAEDSAANQINAVVAAAQTIDYQVPPFVVHCNTCGMWLEPGCLGTSIRVRRVQPSRTQRRRASRAKAKKCQKEAKQPAAGGRQWKAKVGESNTASSPASTASLVACSFQKAKRFDCRNVVLIRCGACCRTATTTHQLPGIKKTRRNIAAAKPSERATISSTMGTFRSSTPRSKSNASQQSSTPWASPVASSAEWKTPPHAVSQRPPAASGTTLTGIKSKKKKRTKQPENGLMKFLSSLNN